MKKGFSIFLSFLLLASHMYLTVGTHFCGGEAVESKVLFGASHLGCSMAGQEGSCELDPGAVHDGQSLDHAPCCQNEIQTFSLTDAFVKEASQPFFQVDFAISFAYDARTPDLISRAIQQCCSEYYPPPPQKDPQVLFQTFLI